MGLPGERMTFAELCDEFLSSHTPTVSINSQRNHQLFVKNLRGYFGIRKLTEIHRRMIEEYRNHRRCQPSQRNPKTTVKGATVNREIQCLHCMFQFAITRKYITESPAAGVKHFDERRERPVKRMLTVEEEQRILEAAPPHLRVAPYADVLIGLPTVPTLLQPVLATVPLQLFACELATLMGHDVDQPRNLAKSFRARTISTNRSDR